VWINVVIHQEQSVAYCASAHGPAECLNRILTERVRGMLLSSNVKKKYWGDKFATAMLILKS
jgi:hypothetical protein